MEIYIACFAGALSSLLLAAVYLADRWEREPVELIQNSFLAGATGQLAVILAISVGAGEISWSGAWMLVTVCGVGAALPFLLHGQAEMDERFDGVVYAVAAVGGAVCVVHLNNLPAVVAASSYRSALESGTSPDLRDLLIVAGSPGFAAELGAGLVAVVAAVLSGAVLGVLQLRGWPPWRTSPICVAVAGVVVGLDLAAGGRWEVRAALAAAAFAAAAALKRRSVFRDRPEPLERDLVVAGAKTVLIVLGTALLASVLLRAAIARPDGAGEPVAGERPSGVAFREPAR